MAVNDKYSYIYNGKEKTGILKELTEDSAIFDNYDILDRDAFEQQAVNLSRNENEISDEIDTNELEKELSNVENNFHQKTVEEKFFPDIPMIDGIPVLQTEENEHVEQQTNLIPKPQTNKTAPIKNIQNPTNALLDKTKKEPENVDIVLEIPLPSKDLFNVLNESIENFEEDFLKYIINNLDDEFIKEQIGNSIRKHYNLEIKNEQPT